MENIAFSSVATIASSTTRDGITAVSYHLSEAAKIALSIIKPPNFFSNMTSPENPGALEKNHEQASQSPPSS